MDEVTDVDRIEGAQKLNQPADVTNALTLYPPGSDQTDPVRRGRARRTRPKATNALTVRAEFADVDLLDRLM